MHTDISQVFAKSSQLQEAKDIISSCVHCGFCTATCPTYQELNDERDGPRGRIYLIKQLLETGEITKKSRVHLDRCLTCRSCETTCPSGVKYGRLIDIGREISEEVLPRTKTEQFTRWTLARVLPNPHLFSSLLFLGQTFKPFMPKVIKKKIPKKRKASPWPAGSHPRVMLALAGCAQSSAAPNTNAASARVLDALGITLVEVPKAGCCGAVNYHLSEHQQGLDAMRKIIDASWPAIEAGAEAIVMTASGCGAMVQEYGSLLKDDSQYASKAARVSKLAIDISQVLLKEDLSKLKMVENPEKVAFHCPCTLQHAMGQSGSVEKVLTTLGIALAKTKEKHLCCGSAGTYSILQPKMSQKLLANKVAALTVDNPSRIVTGNIGCQLHIDTVAKVPVDHWIELVDERVCSI